MNEKGFGAKEFIIIISVIIISMVIITSLFNSITENSNIETNSQAENSNVDSDTQTETKSTYKDLEKKLEKAAERYQNDNYSGSITNPEIWVLSYSMLKEEKYLEKLVDPKDKNNECTGYVEFIQDGGKISYIPYLKCGSNYKTEGYDENNLN